MSDVAKFRTVAPIRGVSSGIGAAVARHLAAADYAVVLNYRSNEEGEAR